MRVTQGQGQASSQFTKKLRQGVLGSMVILAIASNALWLSSCKNAKPETVPLGMSNNHLKMAQQLIRKGDFQSAFMHLNKAMTIRPNDPSVHRDMAWLYLYTNQPERATAELERLEKLTPDTPETNYLAGAIYDYLSQPEKALEFYLKALKASKELQENSSFYFDLSSTLNDLNRHKEALSYLAKGYKLLPAASVKRDLPPSSRNSAIHDKHTNYLFAFCSTYYSLNQIDKALEYCGKAAKLTNDETEKQTIEDFMEKMKLLTLIQHRIDTEPATPPEEPGALQAVEDAPMDPSMPAEKAP